MIIHADKIHTLSGNEPHESWHGWENFLTTGCKVRGENDDVIWYGVTNCNYFVFKREKILHENFGYHADVFWRRIQEEGADVVLTRVKAIHAALKKVNEALQTGDYEQTKAALDELETVAPCGSTCKV